MKDIIVNSIVDLPCNGKDYLNSDYYMPRFASYGFGGNGLAKCDYYNGTHYKVGDLNNDFSKSGFFSDGCNAFICQVGYFNIVDQSAELTEEYKNSIAAAWEEMYNKCHEKGIVLIIIGYWHFFLSKDWQEAEFVTYDTWLKEFAARHADEVCYVSFWNDENIAYSEESIYYTSDKVRLNEKGQIYTAEKVIQEVSKFYKRIRTPAEGEEIEEGKRYLTYAVFGDEWSDWKASCTYPIQHWTRKLGDALGAHCVLDTTVQGITLKEVILEHRDFLNSIEELKPDLVFVNIGLHDILNNGWEDTIEGNGRTFIRDMNYAGIGVIWGPYIYPDLDELAKDSELSASEIKEAFKSFRDAMKRLHTEFQKTLAYSDDLISDRDLQYGKLNSTMWLDKKMLNPEGWAAYFSYLSSDAKTRNIQDLFPVFNWVNPGYADSFFDEYGAKGSITYNVTYAPKTGVGFSNNTSPHVLVLPPGVREMWCKMDYYKSGTNQDWSRVLFGINDGESQLNYFSGCNEIRIVANDKHQKTLSIGTNETLIFHIVTGLAGIMEVYKVGAETNRVARFSGKVSYNYTIDKIRIGSGHPSNYVSNIIVSTGGIHELENVNRASLLNTEVDVEESVELVEKHKFRYENKGGNDSIINESVVITEDETAKFGTSFTIGSNGENNPFGLPPTNEVWIKCDVIFQNADGNAHIGARNADYGMSSIFIQKWGGNKGFYYLLNRDGKKTSGTYGEITSSTASDKWYTVLVHIVSGSKFEAWIDGNKVADREYNIHAGLPITSVYIGSDNCNTVNRFANVIISSEEIGFDEDAANEGLVDEVIYEQSSGTMVIPETIEDANYVDGSTTTYIHVVGDNIVDEREGSWIFEGTPIVRNGAIYLDQNSCIKSDGAMVIGGADFTIDFTAVCFSSSQNYCRLFSFWQNNNSINPYLSIYRNSGNNSLFVTESGKEFGVNVAFLNVCHHYALVYRHEAKTLTLFIDGKQVFTVSREIPSRTYPYFQINRSNYSSGYSNMWFNDFRISSVARWIEDFDATPFLATTVDPSKKFVYMNKGLAAHLAAPGYTLYSETSKYGFSFYGLSRKTRAFNIPFAKELWIKFDVYVGEIVNDYVVFVGNDRKDSDLCEGFIIYNKDIGLRANQATSVGAPSGYSFSGKIPNVGTYTFVMHMVSHPLRGVIELWLNGEKITKYIGDVNDGDYFGLINMWSRNKLTSFSNVIISNDKIDMEGDISKVTYFPTESFNYNFTQDKLSLGSCPSGSIVKRMCVVEKNSYKEESDNISRIKIEHSKPEQDPVELGESELSTETENIVQYQGGFLNVDKAEFKTRNFSLTGR